MVPPPEVWRVAIVASVGTPLTLLWEKPMSGIEGEAVCPLSRAGGTPNTCLDNRATLGQAGGDGTGLRPDPGGWMTLRNIPRP
jgi:hypothetical protein